MKKSIAAMTAITAITAAVCASQSGIVAAQQRVADANYPSKPIRLIVPQQAGSSNDTLSRVMANFLGDALGQQVVVDNRAGVGGIIGALLTGALADPRIGGAEGSVLTQAIGVAATLVWSGGITALLLWVIDRLVGLRVSEAEEMKGLDLTQHGERVE